MNEKDDTHYLLLINYGFCALSTCDAEPCQEDGTVRLVDRPSPNQDQGRLQVCSNNTWEIVCDLLQHSSGSDIAHVVCRQFNYSDLMQSQSSCNHQPHAITSLMQSPASCNHKPHAITSLMQSQASCDHKPHAVQSFIYEEALHTYFACSMLFAHIYCFLFYYYLALFAEHTPANNPLEACFVHHSH